MPFLQLITAQTIKATYFPATESLLLTASGEVQKFTGGISIRAEKEGLRTAYGLYGWVGPLAVGTSPYTYSQTFEKVDYPGPWVLVIDANHPTGQRVPVELLLVDTPLKAPAITSGTAKSVADPVATATPATETVKVGAILNVQSSAAVSTRGVVGIEFDESFLSLETAGITDPGPGPEITWQLEGRKVGRTPVKITFAPGGVLNYITVRPINVDVVA